LLAFRVRKNKKARWERAFLRVKMKTVAYTLAHPWLRVLLLALLLFSARTHSPAIAEATVMAARRAENEVMGPTSPQRGRTDKYP
jgi:hypothetical protein